MIRKIALIGLLALGAAAPAQAGQGSAGYGVGMEAIVPVVCRAEVQASAGRLVEFCNNPGGYEVWLEYAPGVVGEVAVDGVSTPLSPAGRTLISRSATAAARTRALSIQANANVAVVARPL